MITIYTRTTCAQCNMVKRYLNLKKTKYTVINLDEPENQTLVEDLDRLGLRNVPITTNNLRQRFVTGYNPPELSKLL